MKQTLILVFYFAANFSYAQLGSLKNKLEQKAKQEATEVKRETKEAAKESLDGNNAGSSKKESSTSAPAGSAAAPSSSPTATTTSKSGGSAKVEDSPAAATIKKYRYQLGFARDAVNKDADDAEGRLVELHGLLEKIKKEDPNWADYEKDKASFNELKDKFLATKNKGQAQDQLYALHALCQTIEREPYAGFRQPEKVKKSNYDELKKQFEANPNPSLNGYFTYLDNFYQTVPPQVKIELLKEVEEVKNNTTRYTKESRAKSDYLNNASSANFDPKEHIDHIDKGIAVCDHALIVLENDADFTKQKNFLNDRKADLNAYIISPEFEKDKAKRKQMDIDAVSINPEKMNSPQLEAVVTRDYNAATHGTVQLLNITAPEWTIVKNDLGLILHKKLRVEMGTKKDDKCFLVIGYLVSDYEGGGNYTNPRYILDYSTEMNCKNVK